MSADFLPIQAKYPHVPMSHLEAAARPDLGIVCRDPYTGLG
jgi:hypothetical protein